MDDICFSPDSKRLYDVRGQFCNIWEPNALLRVDEAGEQDNEVGSEAASIPTCSVSESFSEMRDQITAVAIQFRGRYHAIGNAIGLVSVVDSLEGDHVGIELWRSPVSLSIEHLSWSCDGTHLACAELTGKVIVKSVLLENDQKWSVLPTFGVKLKVSSEGIRQVLLNQNGKALLVKNGPSVTVWSQTEQSSELKQISLESSDAKWSKHPTDSNLFLYKYIYGMIYLRLRYSIWIVRNSVQVWVSAEQAIISNTLQALLESTVFSQTLPGLISLWMPLLIHVQARSIWHPYSRVLPVRP